MAAKVLFLLAALLLAPLVFAEDIDIENAVVGKDMSGRKLMRSLLHDDGPPMQMQNPQGPPEGWPKKDGYPHMKKNWPWHKQEKKTCFVTKDIVKTFIDPKYITSTTDKTVLIEKKYDIKKTFPVTSYVTSTYKKVKKIPKTYEKEDVSTVLKTFYKTFEKKFEIVYKKKGGWHDDYWVPPQCSPPPED